jgi:O-antigen/teichoic acid export membrane protein
VIANSIKYFFARSISGIAYFFCSIIIIHNYNNEQYGVYSIALSSAQICALLGSTWVGLAANLMIPGSSPEKINLSISNFSFVSFISCVVSALFLLAMYIFSIIAIPSYFIIPSVIFCFAFGLHESQMYILNSRERTDSYSWSIIFRYVLGLIGVWLAVKYTDSGRENALLALALGSLVALTLPTVFHQLSMALAVEIRAVREALKPMFLVGASSMVASGLWTFSTYVSRISLYTNNNLRELGVFAVTTDLANGPIVLIFQAVHLAWAPAVVKALKNGNTESFRKLSSDYISAICLIGVPGLTSLWLVGPSLISELSRGELVSVMPSPLGWVAATTIFSSAFGAAGLILLSSSHKKLVVWVTFAVLWINILIISMFGSTALFVARNSALTIGAGTIVLLLIVRNRVGVSINWIAVLQSFIAATLIFLLYITLNYFSYIVLPLVFFSTSVICTLIVYLIFNCLDSRVTLKRLISHFFYRIS